MQRRHFVRALGGGSLALLALGAGGWIWASYVAPYRVRVDTYRLGLQGLPEEFVGLRIAQVSDLHLGPLVSKDYLQGCMEKVMALDPDLILLTGDFLSANGEINRGRNLDTYLPALQEVLGKLQAPYGVWACLGNHDIALHPGRMERALTEAGVVVLRDSWQWLTSPEGSRLALGGLRDMLEYPNPRKALEGVPPGHPTLLMMHQPDLFEQWEGPENVLVFAGHLHGGQVNIPGVTQRYVPSAYGDKYLSGVFTDGSRTMLVNRGLGVIRHRLRFRSPPEISLVTLLGKL